MHKLTRLVRFSVNPFQPEGFDGYNSSAFRPRGQVLSIFLELSVGLTGKIEPSTGFVVNVCDIDPCVRRFAVPVLIKRITENFHQAGNISFFALSELLRTVWKLLTDKFGPARLSSLSLKLNPFRIISIDSENFDMVYFSEKFEFSATHKLWNNDFSKQKNVDVFGKCANPTGHGHNYIIEVVVKMPVGYEDFSIVDFEKTVDSELISIIDHTNLNLDVEHFKHTNPTVENIAIFAWSRLVGKLNQASLHCINVWETDKTCCSYYG